MSILDYFYKDENGEEVIAFSDAIANFDCMTLADALAYLEREDVPASNGVFTIFQFQVLKSEDRRMLRKKSKELIDNLMKSNNDDAVRLKTMLKSDGNPVVGINNHIVESKDQLKDRLALIAQTPIIHFVSDGAMCYAGQFPHEEAVLKHKCPTCKSVNYYKELVYDRKRATDRYEVENKQIDKYVKEIKALGYEVFVEHMCGNCYEKKFGVVDPSPSVNVLHFKHDADDVFVVNKVSLYECHVLAEFLKGNIAIKDCYDETVWINKYREVLERLLGIKMSE